MTRKLYPAAFLWGLAEATLFFIVPDVLLSAAALRRLKMALVACAWATAGALTGGIVMYHWGMSSPAEAWALLDQVPAISPTMQREVQVAMDAQGLGALFIGPTTGTPYKLYAVAAGQQGFSLVTFLLVSVPARAARFVLVCLLAYTVSRLLSGRFSTPARYGILAGCWLIFYGAYFAHMGW